VGIERRITIVSLSMIPILDTPNMSRKLVVVGAGPVGCLAAISFAKMGWSVEIYEARPGISPSFHLGEFDIFI